MNSSQIEFYDSIDKAFVKSVSKFHTQKITYLKYLPNGYIASCSADYSVNIWDPYTLASIRKYSEHIREVFCIDQIDPDTLVSASLDSTLRIWKISTTQTMNIIDLPQMTYVVRALPTGLIACGLYGLNENNLLLFNYTSRNATKILNGHFKTIYTIEILRDDLMATGSFDTKAIVWNLTTFLAKYTFIGHKDRVYCIKRLTSNLLASADRAGVILIWDWLTNSLVHKLIGHTQGLWTTSLDLFDSQILISGSQDCTVKFWNISNGKLLESINVDIPINALAMLKTRSELFFN